MDLDSRKLAKREYDRTYYLSNRERRLAQTRAYREKNPELARQRVAAWAKSHPELIRETGRLWQRTYQANKRHRVPQWANEEATAMIYRAAEVAKETWGDVEVDHILPLHGRAVSGLHVSSNLQIISAQKNRAKSNLLFT